MAARSHSSITNENFFEEVAHSAACSATPLAAPISTRRSRCHFRFRILSSRVMRRFIAAAEKKLAVQQAPHYVTLDSDGMPIRGSQKRARRGAGSPTADDAQAKYRWPPLAGMGACYFATHTLARVFVQLNVAMQQLVGRVTLDNRGLSGAQVRVTHTETHEMIAEVASGPDGGFSIPNVPAASVVVSAIATRDTDLRGEVGKRHRQLHAARICGTPRR